MRARYLQLFPHQQQDWVNRGILIDKKEKEAWKKSGISEAQWESPLVRNN